MNTNIKNLILVFFLCAPLAVLGKASSQQETNRKIVHTYIEHYLEQGDLETAKEKLEEHLDQDRQDAKSWSALGHIYLREDELSKAEDAFRQAAITAEDDNRGKYLYYYADVLNRQGKSKEAKLKLLEAKDYSEMSAHADTALQTMEPNQPLPSLVKRPDKIETKVVKAKVKKKRARPVDSNFEAMLGLETGYDSNVLLLSDETLDSLARSTTESVTLGFTAAAGYSWILEKWKFNVKGDTRFNWYPNEKASNFNELTPRLGMGGRYRINDKFDVGLRNIFSATYLNLDGLSFYKLSDSVKGFGVWRYRENAELQPDANARYNRYKTGPLLGITGDNDRTGYSVGPGLTHKWRRKKLEIAGGGRYDYMNTNGSNFVGHFFQVPLRLTYKFPYKILGRTSFAFTHIRYFQATPTQRIDYNYFAKAAVGRKFGKRLTAFIQYVFLMNESNFASADYKKHKASLLVNYELF